MYGGGVRYNLIVGFLGVWYLMCKLVSIGELGFLNLYLGGGGGAGIRRKTNFC